MENKGFLTLEEARDQAEYCHEYQEGVYEYRIKGKGYTLIEDDEVLIEGAACVCWHEKGIYDYKKEGEDWVNMKGKRKKPCKLGEAIRKALKLKPSAAKINNKENVEVY